jgi:hypothetical protein
MAIDPDRDLLVLQARGGVEDQPRPLHIAIRKRRRPRTPLKLATFLAAELDPVAAGPGHEHYFAAPRTNPFT